jgi:hypothetical protein
VAERDWAKDLAKIDKQMERMPEPASGPAQRSAGGTGASQSGGAASGRTSSATPGGAPAATGGGGSGRVTGGFGVYARLTLSVVLGVAILVWPYQTRCGWGLSAYLVAVIVVAVSGGWSAVWTWRHRAARAHVLSLLILLWGLVLGSMEILPRIGYATPDATHPASWMCR